MGIVIGIVRSKRRDQNGEPKNKTGRPDQGKLIALHHRRGIENGKGDWAS